VLGPIFHPVNSKPLAIFFTSLRVLLATGMNLSQAMRVLSQQTSNPTLKRAAQEMSEEAARGRPMSSVLGRYPSAFNPTSAAVVEAGEASGMIELTADRLAKYYDRIFQLEQSYRWQTFYPKLLLAALILIPTAKTLFFGGLNAWLVLVLIRSLPLLVAVTLLWYGWRALRSIGPISEAIDAVKLYVPWFGSLARRMATARWARALEMLATAGVPVHQALVAAAAASGNKAMEASLVREAQGVLSGRSLLEVVAMSRAVPPLAVELLAAAEQTGSYEGVLEKIAEYYESETEVGGKQTAVVVGTGFYLIIALLIAIVVISFWRGYFASIGAYLK
jgi:type IV pilus assembly protein PilC